MSKPSSQPTSSKRLTLKKSGLRKDAGRTKRPSVPFIIRRKRTDDAPRRGFVIIAFLVVLLSALSVTEPSSRFVSHNARTEGAAAAGAISSAWYCAATPAVRAEALRGVLYLANPHPGAVTGTATIAPMNGVTVDVPLNVPANQRQMLRLGDVVDAPYASAMLRFNGGGIAVEHAVTIDGVPSVAPCSPETSEKWYFADGTTLPNTSLTLAVFNPLTEDAIVDLTFATDLGISKPPPLEGIIIKGRTMLAINVGDHVHRREWIATTVTARTGRVVADQIQSGRMFAGVPGTSINVGSPTLSRTWYLPNVPLNEGQTARLSFFNPGSDESVVRVNLVTENDVDPFTVHVPGQVRMVLDFPNDRIPKGTQFGVVAQVNDNTPPIVMQQLGANFEPAQPVGSWSRAMTSRSGYHWVFPYGATNDPVNEDLNVMNVGRSPTTIHVSGVGSNGEPIQVSDITLLPMKRALVRVDEFAPSGEPVISLSADQPIVVSRELIATPFVVDPTTGVLFRRS